MWGFYKKVRYKCDSWVRWSIFMRVSDFKDWKILSTVFFRNSMPSTIICFSGHLLTLDLTHESPCFSKCILSTSPPSMVWDGQAVSERTCPLTIVRVEIYTVSNLFLPGLRFTYWTISPPPPHPTPTPRPPLGWGVGCELPGMLWTQSGKGKGCWSSVTRSHFHLDFHSYCQYKRREMTQENSHVLKSHSIHPGVLWTICYHNDHPVFCSVVWERNLHLGYWERKGETDRGRHREWQREKERERKDLKNSRRNKTVWALRGILRQWQAMQQPLCGRVLMASFSSHTADPEPWVWVHSSCALPLPAVTEKIRP